MRFWSESLVMPCLNLEQLKTIGRELAMGSRGGWGQSKEFLYLVKSIGEGRSKDKEDWIVLREIETLKRRIAEPEVRAEDGVIIHLVYVEMLGHDASFGYIHDVKMPFSKIASPIVAVPSQTHLYLPSSSSPLCVLVLRRLSLLYQKPHSRLQSFLLSEPHPFSFFHLCLGVKINENQKFLNGRVVGFHRRELAQFLDSSIAAVNGIKNPDLRFQNPSFFQKFLKLCTHLQFKKTAMADLVALTLSQIQEKEAMEFKGSQTLPNPSIACIDVEMC